MPATLYDLIPRDEKPGNDVLLGRFLDYVEGRRLQLYPAQESAILELFETLRECGGGFMGGVRAGGLARRAGCER